MAKEPVQPSTAVPFRNDRATVGPGSGEMWMSGAKPP